MHPASHFVLMIFTVNGKQTLFYYTHLPYRGDTKDPLSLSLPIASHHYFHTSERPWCRIFARPLLLNHPADSPPEPTAVIPTLLAITAAPSSDWSGVFVPSSCRGGLERVATPRHPLAALCTFGWGCPSSCFAHQPRALFCRAFLLDLVRWHPRLHLRGPTPSTIPLGNSPHLSLRLPLPPCHRTNLHKHTTINGGLVFIFASFLPLFVSHFAWICCVLFDYFVSICWCWCVDEVKLALLVLGLGLLLVLFCEFVIDAVLLSAAVWVLIRIECVLILLFQIEYDLCPCLHPGCNAFNETVHINQLCLICPLFIYVVLW